MVGKDNLKPRWDKLMARVSPGEPTSLVNQIFLESTQRECKQNLKIMQDNERLARIFDFSLYHQTIILSGKITREYGGLVL